MRLAKTSILLAGVALMMWIARYGYFEVGGEKVPVAFPWWALIGGIVAFTFGYLLADPRDRAAAGTADAHGMEAASSSAADPA